MAGETYVSTAARNAACNAVVDLLDAGAGDGTLKIYDGTRPANANTAVTTQVLLAQLTYADPAFGAAAAGVATANAIDSDASADDSGTASWFRSEDSDSNTVMDGDVGLSGSGANLILDSVSITAGQTVSVTSLTYTQPDGT